METVYRVVFLTLIFCHHTRSLEEECNNPLGMQSRSIPDESITSSSNLDSDHEAFYGRLMGRNAWCSTIEDENPYIEITLDEEKAITEIVTQGSSSDLIWSTKYEIEYSEGGKWTSYKEEHIGNRNCCRRRRNSLHPAIRTRSIRIYPKHPFGLMSQGNPTPACLRLELYGCSAPAGCKDPGRPVNGARKGDSFHHGSQITFSCMQDFVLVGDSTSVCHRGKWSHDLPKCKATCIDPGIPENGNRNKNGSFVDGESVEFYCNRNYSLSGPPTIRCLGGRWSSALPQCKASCPDPGIPQNGERVGTNFRHGNDVQFTCKPGFWLVGSRQIVCNEGKWNYKTPKCKAVCGNPGIPVNGKRIGSDFRDGQMVAYRCKPNFNLVGASTVFCVAGQWNATRPTCKATCSDPGTPKHGRRIGSNFGHGHQVTFMCLSKYSLMGSRSMTCHDGKWSSVLPVCKAYCKEPASPQNGARHGNEFEHNNRISFTCLPGFQLTGSANAVCINGKWSHPVPRCKAVCPDPGTPVNGSRIGNSFLDGQTVAFRCQPNYKLVGPLVLRCVAGKWNKDVPKCKAPCPGTSVPSNGQVLDSRPVNRHGARMRFACDSGFKMEGPSSITCNDGKWNSSSPLCKDVDECVIGISDCHPTAVCNNTLGSYTCTCKADSVGNGRTCLKLCKDPGAPTNGARRGDKFQHGKRVSFSCNVGHTLVGNRSMTCLEGEWTSAQPHCRQNCADPGVPSNGLRRGNKFQHGKKVIFVCQPDFKLSGGNSITCIDGIWNDTIPVCTALCKDPGIPQHGARKGDNFEDGNTVNFTCNNGYILVGSNMIECRSGIWSSALPQCKENCADPGAPPNGLRRGNDFQHGKRVIFVCQPDFKLSGVTSITCIDGLWNDTIPVCTALCKDPGIPQHGSRKGDKFEDGKTVNFTCNNGYTLVGGSTIECRKGIWSSALPQCKRPCANPGTPQNGLKIGSDLRHGRKVRFLCQLGFKLRGISSITCQDGRWSDQVPVCKAICKIPTRMNNGVILRDNFDNKGTIEFSCNRGYNLIGSRVLRCVSGQWNDRIPECRKAVCPSPPRLVNGSHDGIDFSIGKNVTYSCNAQYLLDGDPVITCVDGQWVGQVPICRAPCPLPRVPTNGFVLRSRNLQHHSRVQYGCDKGYVLRGSSSSQCNDGDWDSPTPVCEVTCPDPANITDGFNRGRNYSEGGTVTYVCDDQYFLDGSSNITCVNGRWDAPPPVCRAPCPAPVPPANGFVFGESHQHHGIIQFFCKGGFTLRGSSFSECVDGKWNTPKPSCEALCKDPGIPEHGARKGDNFEDGKTVIFTCNNGYTLIGSSVIKCRKGIWSSAFPQCKRPSPSSCRKPPVPMNARMLDSQAQKVWFNDVDRIYYKCNLGFSPSGFTIRRCRNGVWSRLSFRCNAKSCGHPGTPVNGRLNSYMFTYNSSVEYSCNQGYTLVGSQKRVCQANQTWSGTLPQCTTVNCGSLSTPSNAEKVSETSTFLNGQVTFRCIGREFKLVGSATRTCLASRLWSGQQPSCKLIDCGDPGKPMQSIRNVRVGFSYGGSVEFTCNANYKRDGASRIFCKIDGNWSRALPRCLAPCSNPGAPRRGGRTGNDFRHGETVRFRCNRNYRLVGSRELICNNGEWRGVKPRCRPRKARKN